MPKFEIFTNARGGTPATTAIGEDANFQTLQCALTVLEPSYKFTILTAPLALFLIQPQLFLSFNFEIL